MILFKTLRWKNLLSTGNYFTEVNLNNNANTLVVGTNGSGKSTMLDALCFALFGKPFRDINKPNLLNSINGKDCIVEVEFSIGNKEYKVRDKDDSIDWDVVFKEYTEIKKELSLKPNINVVEIQNLEGDDIISFLVTLS